MSVLNAKACLFAVLFSLSAVICKAQLYCDCRIVDRDKLAEMGCTIKMGDEALNSLSISFVAEVALRNPKEFIRSNLVVFDKDLDDSFFDIKANPPGMLMTLAWSKVARKNVVEKPIGAFDLEMKEFRRACYILEVKREGPGDKLVHGFYIFPLQWLAPNRANKSVDVTPTAVTPAADAPGAPSAGVHHH